MQNPKIKYIFGSLILKIFFFRILLFHFLNLEESILDKYLFIFYTVYFLSNYIKR